MPFIPVGQAKPPPPPLGREPALQPAMSNKAQAMDARMILFSRFDPGPKRAATPRQKVRAMIALLVVALLDLKLSASIEGLRVRATLRNDGPAPVAVVVRDACTGSLLRLIVDGVTRPFATTGKRCAAPAPVTTKLAAGAELSALSDALDGRMHHLVVQWRELASPMLVMPTAQRFRLELHATAHAHADAPIDVEIVHVNRSPEDVVIPACGEDRLLVDGREGPLPEPAPCPHEARTLARGGALITRGAIRLPAGHHVLRARWRDEQSDDAGVDVE
jgi:hypothetical protein